MYYENKIESLKQIFGNSDISVSQNTIRVGNKTYSIVDDVIILLEEEQYPLNLKKTENQNSSKLSDNSYFAEDIQFTFGEEWKTFNQILPEHKVEFTEYFDIVDIKDLASKRVCDMGCGIGRWAYFLGEQVRELVLVDFSEAIFEARNNLRHIESAIFFMGDIKNLPFSNDCMDFVYCLGVLHHLPSPALNEVRSLAKYSPNLLIYLYYALDNRPFYFRVLLAIVSQIRALLAKVRNKYLRNAITEFLTWVIYIPCIGAGALLELFKGGKYIPLYQGYRGKSLGRIRQDVYDRFFTRIEQRVSKEDIYALNDQFSEIIISSGMPFWHFLCKR